MEVLLADIREARKKREEERTSSSGYIIDFDGDPYVPRGWKRKDHDRTGKWELNPNKVELYLSENQRNGKRPNCVELWEELRGAPVFNANLLDFYVDLPEFVPEKWDEPTLAEPTRVLFPGTSYTVSIGWRTYVLVRCLARDPVTGWWGWSFELMHPATELPFGIRIAMRKC